MKKWISLLLVFSLVTFVSCDDDDDSDPNADCSGTILEIVDCNTNLSDIATIIEFTDENTSFPDAFSPVISAGDYTFFAPENDALADNVYGLFGVDVEGGEGVNEFLDNFVAALEAENPGSDDPAADAANILWKILAYHLVDGSALLADLTEGDVLTTYLQGIDAEDPAATLTYETNDDGDLGFAATSPVADTGDFSLVIEADLEADNGVIHTVDGVFLSRGIVLSDLLPLLN